MPVNIAGIDLNLLVLFDAVISEKNVSRAAVRVGMSQSAASNALNRLRNQLQDQLFVRTADGVRPTARAAEMAAAVAEGLRNLQVALEPRSAPLASKHWKFVISMSAQTMIAVLPRLLSVIASSPRSVSIHVRPKLNITIQKEIDSMEVDLAVGTIPNLPPRFEQSLLYNDKYVIMMARNNALAHGGVSAAAFADLEQVAVRGDLEGFTRIDRDLQACRTARNVIMNVTQYQVLPKILKATSLISLVPRSVISEFDCRELHFQQIPFAIPEVEVVAVVHRSRRRNTAIQWLQAALQTACSDLTQMLQEPLAASSGEAAGKRSVAAGYQRGKVKKAADGVRSESHIF